MNGTRRRRSRHCHGFTLIETTVAIGVTTMILAVVFAAVATVLRATQSGTRHLAECAAVGRLGRMFRDDVRAAVTASADATTNGATRRLVLELPDEQRIEYRVADGRLLIVRQRQGKRTSRDVLSLAEMSGGGPPSEVVKDAGSVAQRPAGPKAEAWFRIARPPGGELVSLLVASGQSPGRPTLVIEAARGTERRFDERTRTGAAAKGPQR